MSGVGPPGLRGSAGAVGEVGLDFEDLVTALAPPPNRVGKSEGAEEHHLYEGAVMVAFALHLLRTQDAQHVRIHPDGEHGKQFDFAGWLLRREFVKVSTLGSTAYWRGVSERRGPVGHGQSQVRARRCRCGSRQSDRFGRVQGRDHQHAACGPSVAALQWAVRNRRPADGDAVAGASGRGSPLHGRHVALGRAISTAVCVGGHRDRACRQPRRGQGRTAGANSAS